MKRLGIILLALLLAGCAGQEAPQETVATKPTLTEPTGLYDPDSVLEEQTNGAVRVYPLQENRYTGFTFIGEKILLTNESGELTLLSGEQGVPVATMVAGAELIFESTGFGASPVGIAYYAEEKNQVLLCNAMLQQTAQIQMPEQLQQVPVISLAQNEIYYCIEDKIFALDITSGIERLLKQQDCLSQTLVGSYFDGTILACEVIDLNGFVQIQYISTETGQTLSHDNGIVHLESHKEHFFALRMDGTVLQQIIGSVDGTCQALAIPEDYGSLYGVLPMNGVLTCLDSKNGQKLSFFDLDSGEKTAVVTLADAESPMAIKADTRYIWILTKDRTTGKQTLYRWNKDESIVKDEGGSYLRPLYTAQSPDIDGIALQQEHVDWYNEQYGVRIAIWEDALDYAGDYEVVAEYQTKVISDMCLRLEELLPRFPTGFLRKTVEKGWIRIGLVRSIASGETWCTFWKDGDCYVLITPQADVSQALLMGIAYGIDSRILGNSRAYDDWDDLNPRNFAYGEECDVKYLEGEYRYFTDELATQSILEDRSRLFAYAMLPGNDEMFASAHIQKKLRCMCEGIREAYGLEKHPEALPWEQYLETPTYEVNDD